MSNDGLVFNTIEPHHHPGSEVGEQTWPRRLYQTSRNLRWPLSIAAGGLIIALTVMEMHDVLHEIHLRQVRHELHHLPMRSTAFAIIFTVFSFLSLAGQEFLALQSVGRPLPFQRAALGSFIAQSISHSTGFNLLIGGGIRARYYLGLGLSLGDTAATQLAFSGSFGIAMGFLLGGAMLFDPSLFNHSFGMPPASVMVLGASAIAACATVIAFSATDRKMVFFGRSLSLPSTRVLVGQTLFSGLDLIFMTAALFVLLPDGLGVSFPALLAIVLFAISVGVASNVPGGLGVFETVVLALLTPKGHLLPATIGALLAFRVIYYLMPLMIGGAIIAGIESAQQRQRAARLAKWTSDLAAPLTPMIFGILTYACGVVLLISGAIPGASHRMVHIGAAAPLAFIETSHFVASVLGAMLLLLARELTRRKAAAWSITVFALAFGAIVSVMKGLDGEEAVALLIVLALLYPCRAQFYRKSRLGSEPLSWSWLAGICLTIGGVAWLMYFAYRHVQYDTSLWWQFTLESAASRSLRATTAAVIVLLLFAFSSLFRAPRRLTGGVSTQDYELALAIVRKSTRASAHLALTGDKSFLFSPEKDAMLMYGVSGNSWIVMGDPVGPIARWNDLVWEFRSMADRYGARSVFYEVSTRALPILLDVGLQLVKLGEQARIDLKNFSLVGKARAPQRNAQSRAIREGISFAVLEPGEAPAVMDQLKAVSDSWLQSRKAHEKGFSLGSFDPEYLSKCPIATASHDGRIVAFANLWLSADKEECSVDLMRFETNAPKVTMDFLFAEMLLWAQAQGFRWFDLGMAPLSGLPNHRLAPLWSKVGHFAVGFGGHFYSFAGLRAFKDKFDPVWQERYLAYPSGTFTRMLADVVSLISGRVSTSRSQG